MPTNTLAFILGDQLDRRTPAQLGLDQDTDHILMAEVPHESERPPSHVQRTALFFSAMRHAAKDHQAAGWDLTYRTIADTAKARATPKTLAGELARAIKQHKPSRVACLQPGDRRTLDELDAACDDAGVELVIHEDPHFLCPIPVFADWVSGRKEIILEYFYRAERKRLGILVDQHGNPEGGTWNLDKENRKSFKTAPDPPALPTFRQDDITRQVIEDVQTHLPDLPGRIERFDWPVTPAQATRALDRFVEERLPQFGDFQDAMWTGHHTLYHAVIAPALNLKLLDPRTVIERVVDAYTNGHAPLNAVEGFVRQIIGWREFIRGIYWTQPDDYRDRNELNQHGALPEFYWTGDTDLNCLRHALESVLDLSYGHHIARLMLTGNFALIAGVHPTAINDWYLGMYADAVDWVTTPNTVGMAMHADGGVVGTKPYAASGAYVNRMSNYCKSCRYDVKKRTGEDACPLNTFYWDFLNRNRERFAGNRRMTMILKNLERMDADELVQITTSATARREQLGIGSIDA